MSKTSIMPRSYVRRRDAKVWRCRRHVAEPRVRKRRDPAELHIYINRKLWSVKVK